MPHATYVLGPEEARQLMAGVAVALARRELMAHK